VKILAGILPCNEAVRIVPYQKILLYLNICGLAGGFNGK